MVSSPHVIHAVGPVWRGGTHGESDLLAGCYRRALELATAHHLTSIAFPNISTGIYGYPKDKAATLAINTVNLFIQNESSLQNITFICFDGENLALYQSLIR